MKKKKSGPQRALQKMFLPVFGVMILFLTAIPAAGTEKSGSGKAAVTINGEDHSLAEFNYYFQSWYDSFRTENSAMLPYMFDEASSLKEQEYEAGKTWFDYFVEEACLSMQQIVTLAGEAEKEGFALPEAKTSEIGKILDTVSEVAGVLQMDTDDYLSFFYGEGMDTALFTRCLTEARLADGYSGMVRSGFQPSDDEIEAYYAEHLRDYTTVDYERFFVRASSMGTVPSAGEMEKAEKIAEEIYARVSKGESLKDASQPWQEDGAYYSFEAADYIEGSVYGEWLFDPARKDGDLYRTAEINGWYVMVFHSREEADYAAADILDAFFPADLTEGSTDEQLEASCLSAEAFYETWQTDGADRETFEKLVSDQAQQTGSQFRYPSLIRGVLQKSVDKWVFSSERSGGDCEILYSPEGFHVVYYCKACQKAWTVMVKEDLQELYYQEWFDALMEGSVLVRHDAVLEHAGGY